MITRSMRSYAEQQHIMGFQGGLSNPVMDLLLQSIFQCRTSRKTPQVNSSLQDLEMRMS